MWYAVCACYYDGQGRIFAWSQEPDTVAGYALEEIAEELRRMQSALEAPILELRNGGLYEDGILVGSSDFFARDLFAEGDND